MDTRAIFFAAVLLFTGINCQSNGTQANSSSTDTSSTISSAPTSVTTAINGQQSAQNGAKGQQSAQNGTKGQQSAQNGTKGQPSAQNGAKVSITQSTVVTTKVTNPTTTPAPIQCRVGLCNGTDTCLKSTATAGTSNVNTRTCKSGDSCAVVRQKINETYSEYSFSCAANCKASQGKAACCKKSNCIPDLFNHSGDAAVPMSLVSFLGLAIMSVSLM